MAFELQVSGGRTGYDVQVYAHQISEDCHGWRVVKFPWKATGPKAWLRTGNGNGTYGFRTEQDREIHVLDIIQLLKWCRVTYKVDVYRFVFVGVGLSSEASTLLSHSEEHPIELLKGTCFLTYTISCSEYVSGASCTTWGELACHNLLMTAWKVYATTLGSKIE